jgi:cytidylate kinase
MTLRHPSMRDVLTPARTACHVAEPGRRPIVTISRLPGAGGRALAEALAPRLGVELHDRDIVNRIALQAGVRERHVTAMEDEADRPLLTEWLVAFDGDAHLSPHGYLAQLRRAVLGLAGPAGAVILGRAAHLILPAESALRVFVVAPLSVRAAAVAARFGVSEHEAERRILHTEAERRAFLKRYFHAELGDPSSYDLVLNTARLGVAGAADAVVACAVAARPAVHA